MAAYGDGDRGEEITWRRIGQEGDAQPPADRRYQFSGVHPKNRVLPQRMSTADPASNRILNRSLNVSYELTFKLRHAASWRSCTAMLAASR